MNKRALQNTAVVAAAIAAVIAVIYVDTHWFSVSADGARERCYGIVRVNQNDCATAIHSCASQATNNNSPKEFIMLPKGLCERITGGRVG